MSLTPLNAISPIDGRYRSKTNELSDYFSEEALIKYRVLVEIEYFIALCTVQVPQLSDFDSKLFVNLRDIYKNFSSDDAKAIKEIEKVTNHDVKAVEYFIKQKFDALSFSAYKEFIHFGLTSQDINNTAIPLSIKDAIENVYFPEIQILIKKLEGFIEEWKAVPLLARTHGQPASPTRLGKEIEVLKPEKPKGFWDLRVYKASRNQLLLTKAQLLKSLSPGYIDFDRSKKDLHLPADC